MGFLKMSSSSVQHKIPNPGPHIISANFLGFSDPPPPPTLVKCQKKVRKLRQKVACVANFHQQITFIPCNDVVSVSEP